MLIDSNILIYALNSSSPKHHQAKKFLQTQSADLVFAQQNIFETIRILTHSKFPDQFSTSEAIEAVDLLTQSAIILHPTLETPAITFELIKKYSITGAEVFDAYLVATALSNDEYELATDNVKHLKKYKEILVVNPFF